MKKAVNKLLDYSYKFILIFTIVGFAIALIGAIFFYVNRSHNYLNPLILIIGSFLYICLIYKLYKFILKFDSKKRKILIISLLCLQFILLFLSTFIINSIPKVDLIHILTGINSLNNSGVIVNSDYFSVYPNNKFILLLLYNINKISPSNINLLFGLFSSFCIVITSFFTYKTVKEISDEPKALISLFICVFSPIFYLYVSYIYTDILMLPFASILIYLTILLKNNLNHKNRMIFCILTGIVAVIAYKIRAVAIFVVIAYFVYLIFNKKIKVLIKDALLIFISGFLILSGINILEKNIFVDIDKSKEFPMTHWIMMGVNAENNGYYSQDDYNFTASFDDINDKKDANMKVIKERISNQGIIGNTELLVKKIVSVWSKGDYSYQKYLELVKDYNSSYKYLLEDKNIIINYLLQFSKIAILFLCIVSLLILLKNNKKSIVAILLFGSLLFYLIWEVCPRYGLSFLPFMIILTSYSYDKLDINSHFKRNTKTYRLAIMLITLFIFIFNFNFYTRVEERTNVIAKNTVNKIKYVELSENINLTQSLKLNDEFNEIKLKFKFNEEEKDGVYKLDLLNEKMDVLYSYMFSENELNNNEYSSFELDKTYNKGKYIIRLNTEVSNETEVYVSYKEEFDYYPNGVLKINNENEPGDLMLEINNNKNRSVFSYTEYIILIFLTLTIEYVILYRKEGVKNEEK